MNHEDDRLTDTIICGVCQGIKSSAGCSKCGGYGFIARRVGLASGGYAWMKSGVRTVYDGKEFVAYDGTSIIVMMGNDNILEYHRSPEFKLEKYGQIISKVIIPEEVN